MKEKKLMILAIVLLLLVPVCYMGIDEFLSGDEAVTYSMANNVEAGFVFSEGRISEYLSNEVFNNDDQGMISKIFDMGLDVIKNRSKAQILNYPRNPEVRLYSGDEISDWFQKRNYERFNVGTTWLHSLSDDGNSWLYYCLVNISSSIFMGISSTKWSGFIVNILFHFLTLMMLCKIGGKLGNSVVQNVGMLVFYGVSFDIVSVTVTNMRPYTVAAFWATLMVYVILEIYELAIIEGKSFKDKILLLIIVYGIGYVSHYTVGAAYASFGIILLLFMLIGRREQTGIIVLIGVLGILFGILLSPESVIGIIKKFFANGAGSDSQTGLAAVIILMVAVVVFIGVIISIIRDKHHVENELVYTTCAVSLMFIVIVGGTKCFGYARVLFPVTYLVVYRWIVTIGSKLVAKYGERQIRNVSVVLLGIYVITNLVISYGYKMTENAPYLAKESALDGISADTCYYFRKHAQGYMDTRNLLGRFERVQVITLDTDGWEDMVELLPSSIDQPVVFYFADDSEDEVAKQWMKSYGYSNVEDVYIDESTHIFVASNR